MDTLKCYDHDLSTTSYHSTIPPLHLSHPLCSHPTNDTRHGLYIISKGQQLSQKLTSGCGVNFDLVMIRDDGDDDDD